MVAAAKTVPRARNIIILFFMVSSTIFIRNFVDIRLRVTEAGVIYQVQ